ncbi:alpha/beta hydrolase [Dactylosporangium sp. AC04546]|uniref:alpha/beta fold hydrolase n=1 Tax=Dactylosporangium sp. AC04546 TaxID=2862460 RepID=UPI001EE0A827|nr:alpha/beta hydrolase [Dactylosporangium sp. AC04546]WVK83159.1 alpha/beta hydrolase [Dactylosporangium sp. AC04546]
MTDVEVAKGSSRRRKAGIIGAIVGLAAAGVAAGVATERYLVSRSKKAGDPYADEEFGVWDFDEELTVTTDDGIELHVEVVDGPKEGPTLVFVHGFCLDMGTFHFQRKAFEGKYRMVFYDQPGHGRSGRLTKGEYTLDALGAGLRAVLQATAPTGPVVLVGHSMGGMTIMALAEQVPELFENRVEACVLISTSAGKLDTVNFGLPDIVARFRRPLMPVVGFAGPISSAVIDRARKASTDLAWLLTRRYGFGTQRPSPALVSYVEKMNSTTSTDVIARYLRTLYTHARLLVLGPLRRVPVLLVCGDHDVLTPIAHTREIASVLPEAELVEVADGGHVVLLEHADEVNDAMDTFLTKVLDQ